MSQPEQDFQAGIDKARAVERDDATRASQERFDQIERISLALQGAGKSGS